MVFVLSGTFYAQDSKVKKDAEKTVAKTKKTAKKSEEKAEKAGSEPKTATKTTTKKVVTESESTSGKIDGRTKAARDAKKEAAVVKVDGRTKAARDAKKEAENLEAKKSKTGAKVRETTEKAPSVPDKVSGEYNGKKVFTGPKGGRYYINSNGNKTYISDNK